MSVLPRVRRYAERHALWDSGTRVIAAVSGGSDSIAMLLLLHDFQACGELRIDTIAHLNHQIRPEANDDEAFCSELAARLQLPFASTRVDVPALARSAKQSLELAGRVARRRFLDDLRRSTGGDCIATAHTADDQAETVLLRLTRGTGKRGLAGIAPCAGPRIRPVLCATRVELRHELTDRGQTWREDATNADLRHRRNRVRHELLPYLERHFNPAVRRALARLADIERADDAMLGRQAAAAAFGLLVREGDTVSVDAKSLLTLPEALARRVVVEMLAVTGAASAHGDVERALNVAAGRTAAADLSAGRLEHFSEKLVLVRRSGGSPATAPDRGPFNFELPVPGTIQTAGGWVVDARWFDRPQRRDPQPDVAQIDAAAVSGGLRVRNRRPGERLRPVGLGGSKKVQDVLVDRKVTRRYRDAVPIITDGEDRIVWVAGHALGEAFRVTDTTKGVIILKLRRI
jgi:tRNA(Ile)-lysidine synthase